MAVYKISSDALFRTNPDGTIGIMMLTDDEHYFTINGQAASLWRKIDGVKTWDSIIEESSKELNLNSDALQPLSQQFLNDLLSEKLIVSQ